MNPNLEVKVDEKYYSRFRSWPSLFEIKRGANILDIGCGQGILGKYLQDKYSAKVTGIEITPENHALASAVLHKTMLGDVERMDMSSVGKDFDYVIFSDSLEHMLEPQIVLDKMKDVLAKDGSVLISIPNIRNFRATFPLLFADQWEYQDEGLLDRTHLRFFTHNSIRNLLDRCGYQVDRIYVDLPMSSKVGIANLLTFGVFKKILTSHYFVKACLKKY